MAKKVVWSDSELNFLKENFENKTNLELSIALGKSKKNVGRTLKRLNLYKNRNVVKQIKTRRNKEVGRDLSYELISDIAKTFNTRGEFYQCDSVAYNKAVREGWLEDVCKHMIIKRFSVPQLMLKDILEYILNDKCSYNNREIIKPLEIDCYFKKWRIGWEYDGRYFHKENDFTKDKKCKKKGVLLLKIDELSENFRYYEKNIKEQLVSQLEVINKRTGLKIDETKLIEYKPKIVYPNLLTDEEKHFVSSKTMSQIKKTNIELFIKIKKYDIHLDKSLSIKNDIRKNNIFKSFDEYCNYIKSNNFKSFIELTEKEHPYRVVKKFGVSITRLREKINL